MMNRTVEFIYDRKVRRLRRLQNNVFVLYSPKRIRIQPGKKINIDMKLKIRMHKNIVGSCTLLQTFDENGIKLLKSQHISSEANTAINQNYPENDQEQRRDNDLPPPWILTLEIFNRNMKTIFQLRRKQEIGVFVILNDGGEEIRHRYKKEQQEYR